MIKSKTDLREYLEIDRKTYLLSKKHLISLLLKSDQDLHLWRFFKALRILEYHLNNGHRLRALIWERRKNRVGLKYGLFIHPNCLGKGVKIWHIGDIIIHKDAYVGDYCQLHGMNCIGNKGSKDTGVPIIRNNVNIGVGANIIGSVILAEDIIVAANAVVITSCLEPGKILAGIPAKQIEKSEEKI